MQALFWLQKRFKSKSTNIAKRQKSQQNTTLKIKKRIENGNVKQTIKFRDPAKPRKPLNNFLKFYINFQKTYRDANHTAVSIVDAAKLASENWHNMGQGQQDVSFYSLLHFLFFFCFFRYFFYPCQIKTKTQPNLH